MLNIVMISVLMMSVVMPSVIMSNAAMLSEIMLSAVRLNAFMRSVMAPWKVAKKVFTTLIWNVWCVLNGYFRLGFVMFRLG
jgi:hypothetical protein